MFTIIKDHIAEAGDTSRAGTTIAEMPLYGIERAMGESGAIPHDGMTVEFRLYDDDGELYYEGVLTDDDECENQVAALRFGEADAGCTTIKVKRDGEWKQEIS